VQAATSRAVWSWLLQRARAAGAPSLLFGKERRSRNPAIAPLLEQILFKLHRIHKGLFLFIVFIIIVFSFFPTLFSKVYTYPTYPFNYGQNAPEVIKYIWIQPDGKTPCAAEAYDGTFYEFFQDRTTRGVNAIGAAPVVLPVPVSGSPTQFSFVPPGQCTVPNCTNPAEIVFVIDEQSDLSSSDFTNIKEFVKGIINRAYNPATQYGWIWGGGGLPGTSGGFDAPTVFYFILFFLVL
jgi:hypothetical protein